MKMESQIRLINIESIIPNRFQPRLKFDEDALTDLSNSIREHGIIQPLVLRRVADKFEIIAGERRFKAAKLAGLTAVPAIIVDLDDNESAEVAIVENTQRRNLSPIEEAKSYKKLLDRRYLTQDQLAKRMGTSQSNVANKIRLLTLDENVQDALLKDKISERHARSLLKVTDKFKQVELLNKIINEKWTVRKLDEEIEKILGTYNENPMLSGNINLNNKIDVDVDDIVNNSVDILTDSNTPVANYQYNNVHQQEHKKKDSLFFNNLENESANMDPTLSFGFNPFEASVKTNNELDEEDEDGDGKPDYDLLFDEDDEKEQTNDIVDEEGTVKEVYIQKEYTTKEEVISAIKDVISNGKKNEVNIDLEEFVFDQYGQLIIRIFDESEDEKKEN